eukprot:5282535-Amphidinium_carterae.1
MRRFSRTHSSQTTVALPYFDGRDSEITLACPQFQPSSLARPRAVQQAHLDSRVAAWRRGTKAFMRPLASESTRSRRLVLAEGSDRERRSSTFTFLGCLQHALYAAFNWTLEDFVWVSEGYCFVEIGTAAERCRDSEVDIVEVLAVEPPWRRRS